MFFEILKYYTIIIIVFTMTLLLGKLFHSVFFKNRNQSSFVDLVIGFFVIVFFTSIFTTKLKTIFIIPFLFLFLIYQKNKNSFKVDFLYEFNFKEYLLAIVLLLFVVTINFFHYYSFQLQDLIVTYCDDIFYGKMAHILVTTGLESNRGLNEFFPMDGVTPWHYSELWYTGFWTIITNINSIRFHVIITYSIGTSIIALGLNSIFFENKFSFTSILFCFLCTLISGTPILESYLADKVFLLENMGVWISDAFALPKLFPIYILLLFLIIGFKENNQLVVKFSLFLMPICYFTLLPGIFIISFGLYLFEWRKTKKINNQYLLLFLCLVWIPIFYKIFGAQNLNTNFNVSELLGVNLVSTIKSAIFHIVSNPLELLLTYCFFIPILAYAGFTIFVNNKSNVIFYFIFLALVCTSILSGIMFFQIDAWQILANFAAPIINILIGYGFYLLIYKEEKVLIKSTILAISLVSFLFISIQRYSFRFFFPHVSNEIINTINNKEINNGKLNLYWGDYWVQSKDNLTSIKFNGVHSPISYLSTNNEKTWTLNIKIPFTYKHFGSLYPYQFVKSNQSSKLFLQSIKNKVSNVILCDEGQENQIPLFLKTQFKIISIPISK